MIVEFVNSNIVVIANDVNLSIFKPSWLYKHEIVLDNEIIEGCVITPITIQIPTKQYNLSLLQNRIQLSFTETCENETVLIKKVLCKIITVLPETPYTAVGLNFTFLSHPKNVKILENGAEKIFRRDFLLSVS